MIKRIAFIALATTASSAALSEDSYLLEGFVGTMQAETSFAGESSSADANYFGLTVHSGSVSTFDIPLREASFINRASFFSVSQLQASSDDGGDDVEQTEVTGRFVLASGMYFDAGYLTPSEGEDEYRIGLGQYLGISSSATFAYETMEESDFDHYLAELHYAAPYGANTGWLTYDFGVGYIQSGDLDGYSAMGGIDYFYNSRFSLGAQYNHLKVDTTTRNAYELRAEYFFGQKLSLAANYENVEVLEITGETAGVTLNFRY
ncbi:MAG: hypothetical protein KTR35_24700 [Gammaproteobacteria bacterium]|nr:hypothetical protein [Gammaproteobacteria bacterium]